jgi:hypothetical protein
VGAASGAVFVLSPEVARKTKHGHDASPAPPPSQLRGPIHDALEELAALADAFFGVGEEFGVDLVLLVEREAGPGEGDGVGALTKGVVTDEPLDVGVPRGIAEGFGTRVGNVGKIGGKFCGTCDRGHLSKD